MRTGDGIRGALSQLDLAVAFLSSTILRFIMFRVPALYRAYHRTSSLWAPRKNQKLFLAYPGTSTGAWIIEAKDAAGKNHLMELVKEAKGEIVIDYMDNSFAATFDSAILKTILDSPKLKVVWEDSILSIPELLENKFKA